jgi:hypothetical protein
VWARVPASGAARPVRGEREQPVRLDDGAGDRFGEVEEALQVVAAAAGWVPGASGGGEIGDGAFRTEFVPTSEKVFVYGREVNDFRSVDYDAISMLNVSATQELARKVTNLTTNNEALTRTVAAITTENEALKSSLEAMAGEVAQMKAAMQPLLAK